MPVDPAIRYYRTPDSRPPENLQVPCRNCSHVFASHDQLQFGGVVCYEGAKVVGGQVQGACPCTNYQAEENPTAP
jgi:hypothetical protein